VENPVSAAAVLPPPPPQTRPRARTVLPHYPSTKIPPCTHLGDAILQPLQCLSVADQVVGYSDPHSVMSTLLSTGLWKESGRRVANCTHVDVWIAHQALFTSPHLMRAIAALPNVPAVMAVDHSGEVGDVDIAGCMFNDLIDGRLMHGSTDVIYVLVSQGTFLAPRVGQRLFNQHWLVPKELAMLEGGPNGTSPPPHPALRDTLDQTAVNNVTQTSRILCLGGFPRPHKVQFLGELDMRGLLNRILWSAGTPEAWIQSNLESWLRESGYTEQETLEAAHLMRKLPHVLDKDRGTDKASGLSFRSALYGLAPVHLVVESNNKIPSLDRQGGSDACQHSFRYTEKVLKAMYGCARFLVFGDPATLEMLRGHGFQTFHPHINETYDTLPTFREKADAMHLEIARILAMDEREFEALMQATQAAVDHNRRWLLSPEFDRLVYKQSLFAYGLTDEPAFDSTAHQQLLASMYRSLNITCP
jgi:hypothetical protein